MVVQQQRCNDKHYGKTGDQNIDKVTVDFKISIVSLLLVRDLHSSIYDGCCPLFGQN